jgi:hypothetical protein
LRAHALDFEQTPDHFGYVVFDRTDRAADARRFYMIAGRNACCKRPPIC